MFRPIYDRQPMRVVSTEALRRRVAGQTLAKPPAVAPKVLTRVTTFNRWSGYVRAFEMLQLLGGALTPALPRGQFEVSSRWAFYRYFWAFAPAITGQPLRLSDEASRLVDHHRTLASEQLGIGATLLLGRWLVQALHPNAEVDFADADIAVDRGSVDAAGSLIIDAVANNRRMRPDYFFTASERATGNVTVYAVEAKGTHTTGHYMTQMKKGASQVASITINGAAPQGFVFSTELSGSEILVRVLDPDGDPDAWSGPLADLSELDHDESPLVTWTEEGLREVRDPARFRRAIVEAARASLLAFAGQYRAAANRLVRTVRARNRPVLPNAQTSTVQNDLGSFAVIEAELPLSGARARVRTGLETEALAALRERDEARYFETRQRLESMVGTSRAEDDEPGLVWSGVQLDEDERGIRGLDATGLYLEVVALS